MLRIAGAALSRPRSSICQWEVLRQAQFSSSKKSTGSKDKKLEPKSKPIKPKKQFPATTEASSPSGDVATSNNATRARLLAQDDSIPSLNDGPQGRPLFTSVESIAQLTVDNSCSYLRLSKKTLNEVLPEGLPVGMVKEFEDSMRSALLVRKSFLDLRDNFRRIVDPSVFSSSGEKVRKKIVLDGPVGCGKSITLAMLVHWAREEGWLVFYVPQGRDWTHGGYFYKNPKTNLWDTPLQAENALKDFVKYNESRLKQLLCYSSDPIPLGEGAGVGLMKDVDTMALPDNATMYDLVLLGIQYTHAAVGVLVRLREELSLVKDVPVLIAVDQVHAFRTMMHDDMMVGAFSHSTAVGKLRQDLPDVPPDARVTIPRYNLEEAATVSYYYLRQRLFNRETFSDEKWKKMFYISNGNGKEMRCLAPLIQ